MFLPSAIVLENNRHTKPPPKMIKAARPYRVVSPYNVELARSLACQLSTICVAIPEDVFCDSEVEAVEFLNACDKVRLLLNVLEA